MFQPERGQCAMTRGPDSQERDGSGALFSPDGWARLVEYFRFTPVQERIVELFCRGLTVEQITETVAQPEQVVAQHVTELLGRLRSTDPLGAVARLVQTERLLTDDPTRSGSEWLYPPGPSS